MSYILRALVCGAVVNEDAMRKFFALLFPLLIAALALSSCSPVSDGYGRSSSRGPSSVGGLYRSVNLQKDLIPKGRHARKFNRPMNPRYITIHSTQNFSRGADADRHSSALKNGKLRARRRPGGNRIGYLVWHYTVDDNKAVQHLPNTEQGEHADFGGPGNRLSIGIEMCEHPGNSRAATMDRTARLTAALMRQYNIPINNIVPHYHWPRRGLSPAHKNCPHYLLDNGRPGRKWRAYKAQINSYYRSLQ